MCGACRHAVDEVEIERLCGEAAVIDVRKACEADPDYEITPGDLFAREERTGRRLVDVIVLLRTGWASRWPDRLRYIGTEKRGAEGVAELHFPGLSPEAAKWLVEQRRPFADRGPDSMTRSRRRRTGCLPGRMAGLPRHPVEPMKEAW